MNFHCYSRNAMIAKPVLHQITLNDSKKVTTTTTTMPVTTTTTTSTTAAQTTTMEANSSKSSFERKMELHNQHESLSLGSLAKDKLIRFRQLIISQSRAPYAGSLRR